MNIHNNGSSFREFLQKIIIIQFKGSSLSPVTGLNKNNKTLSLKDYLLQKYIQVYGQERESLIGQQSGEECIGQFENDNDIIKVRLKIGILLQEEPFLIVSFNDRLDEENINFLKNQGHQVKQIFKALLIKHRSSLMLVTNFISKINLNLAQEMILQIYVTVCSVYEYLQNSKKFLQSHLQLQEIKVDKILKVIGQVYPQLSIIVDESIKDKTIFNDIIKIKLVLFSIISMSCFEKDEKNYLKIQMEQFSEEIQKIEICNRSQKISDDFELNKSSIQLKVEIKKYALFESLQFTISTQKRKKQNLSPEELVLREIQDECVRYYLALTGPKTKPQYNSINIFNSDSELEFEFFTDLRKVCSQQESNSNTKNLGESLRIQTSDQNGESKRKLSSEVIKQKSASHPNLSFNPNIVFDRKKVTSNPHFQSYCKQSNVFYFPKCSYIYLLMLFQVK